MLQACRQCLCADFIFLNFEVGGKGFGWPATRVCVFFVFLATKQNKNQSIIFFLVKFRPLIFFFKKTKKQANQNCSLKGNKRFLITF